MKGRCQVMNGPSFVSTSLTCRALLVCSLLLTSGASLRGADLPRLHASDERIVGPDNQPVFLHGVNLGNWLLIEPGGLGGSMGLFRDQYTLFKVLADRFGESERRRLIGIYRDSFITSRDFDNAQRFGFNFVRLGFDYELLEDDAHPMQLRPDAFKYLDFAVQQAKARGIYVLIDLHGAQERQVNGKQAGRTGYTRFWIDARARERSLWMWREIQKHFKGEAAVMGYEALNEPFSAKESQLRDYCDRWYKELREVDSDAIAVFPGLTNNIDFYGNAKKNGWTNCMLDMHFYVGSFRRPTATQPITPASNIKFVQIGLPHWVTKMHGAGMPLLIGEMNVVYKQAGGGEMVRRYFDFAREQGWAISYWTIKELTPGGGVHDRAWSLTTNANAIPPVDIHTSSEKEIEAGFRSLATMPLVTNPDLLHWLTTDQRPSPLAPAIAPASGPADVPSFVQPQ